MDASILTVMLGVISNVLTSFLLSPFQKGEAKQVPFDRIIKNAIEDIADTFQWAGTPSVEEVCLFLTSPEVEAVIRQIFSVKLSESKADTIKLIRQEFVALFGAHFELRKGKVLRSASDLYAVLLEGVDKALVAAIENGILSAHEAKSVVRYRQLLDEIAVVQKNLDFLTARTKPNIQAILEFEMKYRSQIADRHGRITPPNFDSARKLPINDIYVAPRFAEFCKPKDTATSEDEKNNLSLADFLGKIYRAVLLGNPGGGKSTLKDKICFDLAFRYSERLLLSRELTPIPVILRDYGSEKKAKNCSILEFIESTANSTYQIHAPKGAVEYLLLNGRVVIIFDGLDELLETSYRQKITADVESFCNLYPSVPVLVTSREVGYEQAPLNEKNFEAFSLATFDEGQVTEYVTKWFRADGDLTNTQRELKTQSFLKESRIVPDLRSNPLMLALMCNIYRGENYIPQNRPDLYEKCAVMLFERWDKNRGIIVPLPFEAHIRPAMMYLAHWIYTNASLQSGVDEKELINKSADYLLERRFDDRDEAEMAARQFIDFCKGRAWVFTDTGAGLYQFTHRTFLEYFTAFHLVRRHSSPESLLDVLIERIAKREWDIVSQLAIQLLNKFSEGAGDEILTTLVDRAKQLNVTRVESWNLISFAVRCLDFIVPSSRVRKHITCVYLEQCLELGKSRIENPKIEIHNDWMDASQQALLMGLSALLNVTSENQPAIVKTIEEWLVNTINSDTDINASMAIELLAFMPTSIEVLRLHQNEPELGKFWGLFSDKIFKICRNRIDELMRLDRGVCNIVFWRREVDIEDFIGWHGLSSLFNEQNGLLVPWLRSPAYQLLGAISSARSFSYYKGRNPTKQRIESDFGQIKKLATSLLSSTPPWVEGDPSTLFRIDPYILDTRFTGNVTKKWRDKTADPDTNFSSFAIIATGLETSATQNGKLSKELSQAIKDSNSSICLSLRATFLARFDKIDEQLVLDEMDEIGLRNEQRTLIFQWIRREVNFMKPIPRSKLKRASSKKPKPKVTSRS